MTDAPDMNRRGALKALLGFAAAAAGATAILGPSAAEAAPLDAAPKIAPQQPEVASEETLPEHEKSQYYVVRRRYYRRPRYYYRPRRVYRRRYVRRVYVY